MKIKIVALLITAFFLNSNASDQPKHKRSSSAPAMKAVLPAKQGESKQEQEEQITVFLNRSYENEYGKFNEGGYKTVKASDTVASLTPYIHSQFKLQKEQYRLYTEAALIENLETTKIKDLPAHFNCNDKRYLFIHTTR
jgi:hypothetical protein